ncbi:hypothetical protein BRADI_2g34545v3 [Brachypodium distachyon]|uniref:Uncharacterized protein n=1 Tax=Brachypodium distachyon TaxID=15368 RepID=A0A0Q3J3H9_BRADI|nr:hypothetical protein BRADI_2g34545v3 [Brachypodium distachyon]
MMGLQVAGDPIAAAARSCGSSMAAALGLGSSDGSGRGPTATATTGSLSFFALIVCNSFNFVDLIQFFGGFVTLCWGIFDELCVSAVVLIRFLDGALF